MNRLLKGYGFALLTLILLGTAAYPLCAEHPARVVVVEITDEVDRGMLLYISRALDDIAKQVDDGEEWPVLVLDVNTFGGRVDVATEIRDLILAYRGTSVAYVNPRAISAGALISLSADRVYMAPGSSMGAVTPVTGSGEEASQKVVSYMRGEMRGTAEQRGRDPLIAEAMVDKNVELDSSYSFSGRRPLTLTTKEAVSAGFVDGSAENLEAAMELLNLSNPKIVRIGPNTSETFVGFLANPFMNSLLIMLGLGGLFYTVKTGHAGIGLGVGLLALGLFFTSQYVVDLANVIEMVIFAGGILLIAAEIFVIPGFGIAGISGLILVVTGLFLAMVGSLDLLSTDDIVEPVYTLAGAFAGFFVLAWAMYRFLPHSSRFRRMSLMGESVATSVGDIGPDNPERFVGMQGSVVSTLRPAGVAQFGDETIDVVAESGLVRSGESVVVTSVDGRRVIVRALPVDEKMDS